MCVNGHSNSGVSTNTTHANVKRKNTISTKGGKSEYSPRDTSKTRSQKHPKKLLGEIKINSERDGKKFGKLLRSLEVAELDDIKTDSAHNQPSLLSTNFFSPHSPPPPHPSKPRHPSKHHSKPNSKHQSPILHSKNPIQPPPTPPNHSQGTLTSPNQKIDTNNFKYHINSKQPLSHTRL